MAAARVVLLPLSLKRLASSVLQLGATRLPTGDLLGHQIEIKISRRNNQRKRCTCVAWGAPGRRQARALPCALYLTWGRVAVEVVNRPAVLVHHQVVEPGGSRRRVGVFLRPPQPPPRLLLDHHTGSKAVVGVRRRGLPLHGGVLRGLEPGHTHAREDPAGNPPPLPSGRVAAPAGPLERYAWRRREVALPLGSSPGALP